MSTILFPLLTLAAAANGALVWSSCGQGLDCATLSVPLEYAKITGSTKASVPLVRYNATVPAAQRKGSLLVNPGGPGASGRSFVLAGGEAMSVATGGAYDIIGWDPRGVGESEPLLACFKTAGEEYDFSSVLPAAAELWLGEFGNSTYDQQVNSPMKTFDASAKSLADACSSFDSPALMTSSSAYVVRDMARIVDELDGTGKPLNYWGLSYGTIFGVEFMQTFPQRVGRMVLDGVFDAAANAKSYDNQLPNDQISVRAAMNDFAVFCTAAGPTGCTFASPPANVAGNVASRVDALHEALFRNPIQVTSDLSITVGILSATLWSFSRVPTTWPLVANALAGLEKRDPSALLAVLSGSALSAPSNRSAPALGLMSLSTAALQCIDNAGPSSAALSLPYITSLVANISIAQQTPWLGADVLPITYCSHFPPTRPLIANLGSSKLSTVDASLAKNASKPYVLIVNPEHDTNTPLISAKRLRQSLPKSSKAVYRRGPGHTSVSLASLGLAKSIRAYFNGSDGVVVDGSVYNIDQVVFGERIRDDTATPVAVFNGTYTADEEALLEATHGVLLAFLAIG